MNPQDIVNLFIIPFSFFTVIFSILLFQWLMVNIISNNISRLYINHPILFRMMNWWGVFVHEASHAITAIATLNKVEGFRVSSNGGYVKHSSRRSGFFQWLAEQSISISPSFVPPLIAAVLLKYSGYIDFHNIVFNAGSLEPVHIISTLYLDSIPYIVKTVGWLFLNLNYSRIENILLLLILTFSFSSAKPSSIKGKGMNKGDIQFLIENFIKFPVYTMLSLFLGIASFWILLKIDLALLLTVLTFLILLPVLSIFALVFNYLFIMLLNAFDKTSIFGKILAVPVLVLVYAAMDRFTGDQYLINMTCFGFLVGFLKLVKMKL